MSAPPPKSVRIIPPPASNGVTLARGTRVMVGDEEVRVSRIDLTAKVGDAWRCTLETMAVELPEGITVSADIPRRSSRPLGFLQSMTWTPHEMARYQDAARGVHRRFADWQRSPRGVRYAERMRELKLHEFELRWRDAAGWRLT